MIMEKNQRFVPPVTVSVPAAPAVLPSRPTKPSIVPAFTVTLPKAVLPITAVTSPVAVSEPPSNVTLPSMKLVAPAKFCMRKFELVTVNTAFVPMVRFLRMSNSLEGALVSCSVLVDAPKPRTVRLLRVRSPPGVEASIVTVLVAALVMKTAWNKLDGALTDQSPSTSHLPVLFVLLVTVGVDDTSKGLVPALPSC